MKLVGIVFGLPYGVSEWRVIATTRAGGTSDDRIYLLVERTDSGTREVWSSKDLTDALRRGRMTARADSLLTCRFMAKGVMKREVLQTPAAKDAEGIYAGV